MLVNNKIEGFPYPERFCPYCAQPLSVVKAFHDLEATEDFKAVYFCFNDKCEVFDEAARKCYVKTYYSNKKALDKFYMVRIWTKEREKR